MLRRFAGTSALVAAAFLAAGCTESSAPAVGKQLPPPLFSYSPNGITLNALNGSLNYSGTLIRKGFDGATVHHGDAIIATFFWLGSTNIIDSVTDVLTDANFTRVGNTYHLVEYVTAGGISMATYVATNVQNFPDPPQGTVVLAVQANLSQSVADGGVQISTWTGVEDVFAQALGAHHSATASGSGTFGVAPGPISVNANALVFGVSMARISGLTGREPPTGFTQLAGLSDDSILADGEYIAPASAGSSSPQWSYTFGAPSTALATVFSLNVAPAPQLAPPTNCLLEKIPPPSGYLKVSWTNSGESGVSTEVSIFHNGSWNVVSTVQPGIASYFYILNGQTGQFTARVRHVKAGYPSSTYCVTGSVTV